MLRSDATRYPVTEIPPSSKAVATDRSVRLSVKPQCRELEGLADTRSDECSLFVDLGDDRVN
jgi:hypothetical protein